MGCTFGDNEPDCLDIRLGYDDRESMIKEYLSLDPQKKVVSDGTKVMKIAKGTISFDFERLEGRILITSISEM